MLNPRVSSADVNVAREIDRLLRDRGFERTYLNGGPPMEPSFDETDRGCRCYMDGDNERYVIVTRRGTWRIQVSTQLPSRSDRGHGPVYLRKALDRQRLRKAVR